MPKNQTQYKPTKERQRSNKHETITNRMKHGQNQEAKKGEVNFKWPGGKWMVKTKEPIKNHEAHNYLSH